ncbi:MAG: hypothetical protein HOP12_16485, partial [Candidatus Eisenbacteria bacterium]|nr:hypothetical protein [Candidatus Eisenbacteria bacterium]
MTPAPRKLERRVSTRADAQLSMRLGGAVGMTEAPAFVTETQNVSSSGVYCLSPHYLAPLSKVDLTLVLPQAAGARKGEKLLKCEAVVVRCLQTAHATRDARFELACSFLGLEEAHRRMLEEFVTYRNLKALANATRGVGRGSTAVRRPASAR